MSLDQNAGQGQIIMIHNSFFERVEEFKYLGTNKNYIKEKIKEQIEFRECLLSFGAESFFL
jgi:hypothetical protein